VEITPGCFCQNILDAARNAHQFRDVVSGNLERDGAFNGNAQKQFLSDDARTLYAGEAFLHLRNQAFCILRRFRVHEDLRQVEGVFVGQHGNPEPRKPDAHRCGHGHHGRVFHENFLHGSCLGVGIGDGRALRRPDVDRELVALGHGEERNANVEKQRQRAGKRKSRENDNHRPGAQRKRHHAAVRAGAAGDFLLSVGSFFLGSGVFLGPQFASQLKKPYARRGVNETEIK
jgi:hypothetical protein